MFRRHKTVDFRTINVRVGRFNGKKVKTNYRFLINDLWIENIPAQQKALVALKTELYPGDSIELDTYFGWYDGKEWLTFPLKGRFRILDMETFDGIPEIRLKINPIRLKFPVEKVTIR